jgi:transposase-like protein
VTLISYFQNEESAYTLAEKLRWPQGPVCSHCGHLNSSGKLRGLSTHPATWKCYDCRKPFNVRLHSLFEGSHVPLHVWFQAMYIFIAHEDPISIGYITKSLLVTEKMARNIRQFLTDEERLNCCITERKNLKANALKSNFIDKKFISAQVSSKLWPMDNLVKTRFDKFCNLIEGYDRQNIDKQFIVLLTLFLSHELSRSYALKQKSNIEMDEAYAE